METEALHFHFAWYAVKNMSFDNVTMIVIVNLKWIHTVMNKHCQSQHIYTTGKKYGIFFISATFCIFVGGAGYFCIWNTFLRADITFGGVN